MKDKKIDSIKQKANKIQKNIAKLFVGKTEQIQLMLMGLISGLHVLIIDVPGVGKTTLAKCLAASVGLDFSRIQFTPDLLPGDITGMTVWDINKKEFVLKKGAIIHQFILADEINRAAPRTQSSLLEAMQDESVSIDGKTYPLPQPFFVIATQNPPSFLGTFQLPEVELDRFGLSFSLGYPVDSEALEILDKKIKLNPFTELSAVISPQEIIEIRKQIEKVFVTPEIKKYLIEIAKQSRASRFIKLGMSIRAMQHLILAARARSVMEDRDFVIPEDIINSAIPVLNHRIVLSSEARIENKNTVAVINSLLERITVPA